MVPNDLHMKRGFTLIELLAATALAALLMVAGFRVISSLGRARLAVARQEAARSYAPEVLDVVRWDLTNARYMKAGANELTLTGYNGLDAATLRPTHRPVAVRYLVRAAAGGSWLVREQTDLDVPTNQNRWASLVCPGVGGFQVQTVGAAGKRVPTRPPPRTGSRRRLSTADRTGWEGPADGLDQPADQDVLPDRLWLAVRPDGPGGLSVEELISIR